MQLLGKIWYLPEFVNMVSQFMYYCAFLDQDHYFCGISVKQINCCKNILG
jgi:hypothetical protein